MNNNEAHLSVVLNVPSDYTGRVLVYLEKGRVKCQCRLMENEFISTLAGFSEMLTKSGVSADQLRGGDYAKHDIEDLAFEALHSAKKIREVVNMWMNSLSTDESDSREEILISLLLDLANTQVSLTSDIELAAKNLPLE